MKKKHPESLEQWLSRLPGLEDIPFAVDRRALYRVADLYEGYDPKDPASWTKTFDRSVYGWTLDPATTRARQLAHPEVIAARLHDVAVGRAIDRFLGKAARESGKPAVGFMGGHDTNRNDPAFRQIATIARALRQAHFTIVSGGGPGLMEAANFGAFMAPYTDAEFGQALTALAEHPNAADHAAWVASAFEIRKTLLTRWSARERAQSESLGIPTWYYGNEPPNLFASHTGKYFFNSVREDGLVCIASGGIIFGPGKAGTVQEVFQDAPLNFYRQKGTRAAPMMLLGADYWNPPAGASPEDGRKPVWPLLSTLAHQAGANDFSNALLCTDDAAAIVKFISEGFSAGRTQDDPSLQRVERFKGRAFAAL